ncbi:TrmB family transcriptional regulator [Haloplanus aerogenes]|uniref:Sugar-specific transcriptional regulator TrmB n=1 Tax=Haloplanus aerogenes TaxID=660522 RepID=A0A3M0DRW7_9EURY|nr:helix-turn-helix domain-containing protein [Haloplanus aerogenes]RMB24988.1 sugar-specific transcriptional regulator TrmB [Haloplanus aerogenes]
MTNNITPDTGTDSLVEEVVSTLRTFELTEYEAKCFVALTRLREGTAKEVSDVADVPRARIYDSMDALQDRGLVSVQESKPRRFRAVSPREAVDLLERECRSRLDRLGTVLPRLGSPERSTGAGEVWTMEGEAAVSERLATLVIDADDEVLFAVATEALLGDDLIDALADATDRGVDVVIGSPAEPIRERLQEAVPDADVVETWTWWESHPIQPGAVTSVCMVDGDALLVSADAATDLPGVRKHRAIWTDSAEAPVVGLMRPLLSTAIRSGD